MPRPARFDHDELLDRAVELAATAGPPAVTMANVARAAGAPSGSVYYRFPTRAALLAELWLRTVGRFQDGCLEAIEQARTDAADDPLAGCAAAARYIVEWSAAHVGEAHVMLHGAEALERETWSADALERSARRGRQVEGALRRLARDLGRDDAAGRERVVLATVDVPYALVRRHLRAGTEIPATGGDLAEEAARALLCSR